MIGAKPCRNPACDELVFPFASPWCTQQCRRAELSSQLLAEIVAGTPSCADVEAAAEENRALLSQIGMSASAVRPVIVTPAGVIPPDVVQAVTDRIERRAVAVAAAENPRVGWLHRARKRLLG